MKPYRYNTQTKQIHRVDNLKPWCNAGTPDIKPDGPYWHECRGLKAWMLIAFAGYDGCGHCWEKRNRK